MIVKTLWGLRKGEDTPELMEAWDEYCVDGKWDGWNEACEKTIQSWGNDLAAHRYIDLDVSGVALLDAFDVPVIGTEVAS